MEIVLRIFAGPHLGAEIMLPEGSQVIGSGDSCDIILYDSSVASRHAALEIGTEEVWIRPLDGEVLLNDAVLTEDVVFPPRTPCFLGLSCLAWDTPENTGGGDAWHEVTEALTSRQSAKSDAETTPLEENNKVATTEVADATEVDIVQLNEEQEVVPERRSWGRRLLWFCLAVLCLCGLLISWQAPRPNRAKQQQFLAKTLQDAGFPHLVVRSSEEGVVVEGFLKNDDERGKLVRLVQKVHFPVGIRVKVGADRFDAAKAAFNSRGIYPEITEDEKNGMLVSGYIKDAIAEEWAFNLVREDIPGFWAERNICHARDVEAVLQPLLRAAGLEKNAQRRYLSGILEIIGNFDERQHGALQQALSQTRKELNIPLRVNIRPYQDIVIDNTPQPLENEQRTLTGKRPNGVSNVRSPERGGFSGESERLKESQPVLNGFQVKSVVMTPMRFITLESGERIFEGGLLPTGQTLETVGIHALKLRGKDGTLTVYPLKGKP